MTLPWSLWVVAGYLAGSIPFALLLGLARGVDVRQIGSGNVGATNLGRALGRKWGIGCFVLDVLKGLLPVLLAGWQMNAIARDDLSTLDAWRWLAVGAAAVIGHVFPVWLKFRGGKGVATALGVLLGFWPMLTLPGLAGAAAWVVLALAFRYISLASVAAAAMLPVFVLLTGFFVRGQSLNQFWPFLAIAAALAALVVVKHRANLARLRAGTEPKFGKKQKVESEK